MSNFSPVTSKGQTFNRSFFIELFLILIIGLTAILVNLKMLRYGVIFQASDLEIHLTWLQHFSKQIAEGIWYPRWLAGTNYGYGSPTFTFYPPLVYYIGSVLKLGGLNADRVIVFLCLLAVWLAGTFFYVYGRQKWGIIPSLLGAVVYVTVPYLSINLYIRGALPETWSFALLPLGLLITEKAIIKPKWRILQAIIFAVLALTHVPSLLLFTIFWLPYTFSFLLNHSWKPVGATIISGLMGLGIASFYLLPAIGEKYLVNIESMRNVSGGYQTNLIGNPLFIANNDFSRPQIQNAFLYQLGACILFAVVAYLCDRQDQKKLKQIYGWLGFILILAFLMVSPSAFIWASSKTLQMVQFPWRLLVLFSLGVAALCSIATDGIIRKNRKLLIMGIVSCIILNWGFNYKISLLRAGFYQIKDVTSEAAIASNRYQVFKRIETIINNPYADNIKDAREYIPLLSNGQVAPAPAMGQPTVSVTSGKAEIKLNLWGSYNRIFHVIATSPSTIRVRTYYYPAWHLYANKKPHPIEVADDGTMQIQLEPGSYTIELRYQWTRFFTLGVVLSVLSILALLLFWIKTSGMASVPAKIS